MKSKVTEYNAKYHRLEIKQNQLRSLIMSEDECDSEHKQLSDQDDDEERQEMLKKSKSKRLSKS